jgi:hypothetical protein
MQIDKNPPDHKSPESAKMTESPQVVSTSFAGIRGFALIITGFTVNSELDFLCLGSDGECVHRLFLAGFLSSHDAQCVLLLFSTGRRCFSNVFQVVV